MPFLSLIGLTLATALLVMTTSLSANDTPAATPDPAQMRSWIEEMKTAPRGPFRRIRWFCEDGSVLPPEPYACSQHGGGIQHGEWNERTLAIRQRGYLVANLLAELEPADYIGPDARLDALRQILLERFLIGFDDGWIFRRARFYRGAIQVGDEQRQARALLLAMLGGPEWRTDARYALLREAVRLLPIDEDRATATTIRELSTELAEEDPGFQDLRVKLHGMPGAGDAGCVPTPSATPHPGCRTDTDGWPTRSTPCTSRRRPYAGWKRSPARRKEILPGNCAGLRPISTAPRGWMPAWHARQTTPSPGGTGSSATVTCGRPPACADFRAGSPSSRRPMRSAAA
jgi:hypothetical protein